MPCLFVCLALAYLVSTIFHGPTLTMISETSTWFAVVAVALVASVLNAGARAWVLDALCWFGAVCSVVSAFVFVDAIPLAYGMFDGRLQFPFQYANASAAWFGATAFLCLLSSRQTIRGLVPLPMFALMLTKSAGAALVFAPLCVAIAVVWAYRRSWGRLSAAMLQAMLATVAFVLVDLVASAWAALLSVVLLALSAVLFSWVERGTLKLPSAFDGARACFVLALVAAGAVAVVVASNAGRIGEALTHLFARWVYVFDAASLVSRSPVLGVGPDVWQYVYPSVASAQYSVSVVHCSYAQAACDAGIVGLILLMAIVVVGCVLLARSRDARCLLPAVMVALHALFDFDLQFGALACSFAVLLCGRGESALAEQHEEARRGMRVLPVGLASISLVACLMGVACASMSGALATAASRGDDAAVERVYLGNPLAYNDPGARADYLQALYRAGRTEDVVASYAAYGVTTFEQAVSVAWSLDAIGEPEEGLRVLLQLADAQPYNAALFHALNEYAEMFGVPDDLAARYRAAIDTANRLAGGGYAALFGGQETFEELENADA